jgi:cardiolipin synthase
MPPRESFLTVANLLSLSRLPLGAVFAWTLAAGPWSPWSSLIVLAMAGASDALDGWFARRAETRRLGGAAHDTPAGMGSWLDPICDKLFVTTVLASIWLHFRPPLGWLALILARELAQLPLSLFYLAIPSLRRWLRYDFRASVSGKAATALQFCAIVALIFRSPVSHALAIASFSVGLMALADYVRRAVRMGRQRSRDESEKKIGPV